MKWVNDYSSRKKSELTELLRQRDFDELVMAQFMRAALIRLAQVYGVSYVEMYSRLSKYAVGCFDTEDEKMIASMILRVEGIRILDGLEGDDVNEMA